MLSCCYWQNINIPTVIYSKCCFAFALNNYLTRLSLTRFHPLSPPHPAGALTTLLVMHTPSFSCSPLHLDTIYTPLDSERERTLKMRTPRVVLPLLSLLLQLLLLLLLLHYALSKVAVAFWRSFFRPLGRLQTRERVSKSFGHIPAHASTLKLHLIINCVRARERDSER